MSNLIEAASVVLARRPGSEELFLVQRAENLRFFGGFCAFPGGKVGPSEVSLASRFRGTERLVDRFQEPLHRERLADVVDDPEVLGVRLVPAPLVGGNHDDRRSVGLAAEVFEYRVAAHPRHHHVEDHQVWLLVVDRLFALVPVVGLDDLVPLPLQDGPQPVHQFAVIVHHQYHLLLGHDRPSCISLNDNSRRAGSQGSV